MESKFKLGEIVYLITDSEQLPRMVTSVKFTLDGGLFYSLANGTQDTSHYEQEMSKRRNMEIVLGLNDN